MDDTRMLNKRKRIIIGIVIIIVITILFVLSQRNKKTVHETVSKKWKQYLHPSMMMS